MSLTGKLLAEHPDITAVFAAHGRGTQPDYPEHAARSGKQAGKR
ncbi:MAG TPA: hypothetical protein VNH18_22965 [Bryobacteraceae bacterium]|nr:hypothetical protein [Bryobacteraceae bacterium]